MPTGIRQLAQVLTEPVVTARRTNLPVDRGIGKPRHLRRRGARRSQ